MTSTMSSRNRMMTAIHHQEPDRIPIAFDSPECSIHQKAHRNLIDYLGIEVQDIAIIDRALQAVRPDEQIKRFFNTDTYCVVLGEGSIEFDSREDGYIDEWGIHLKHAGEWYNVIDSPLKEGTFDELKAFTIPNPSNSMRTAGLAKEAISAKEAGYFVHAGGPWGVYEISSSLRGPENLLMDMLLNPAYVEALADRVLEHHFNYYQTLLNVVGDYIEAIAISDDLGGQQNLLFSPDIFRKIYKPRLRQLIDHIRQLRPHIFIYMHSDGAIFDLIPDLLEIGIDGLNPIQFSAKGMDPIRLKKTFCDDLVIWGGGVDNLLLAHGSPEEIERQVAEQIRIFAPGGGYVFSSVHNISAEVPPVNIEAFFNAAHKYGRYPISS